MAGGGKNLLRRVLRRTLPGRPQAAAGRPRSASRSPTGCAVRSQRASSEHVLEGRLVRDGWIQPAVGRAAGRAAGRRQHRRPGAVAAALRRRLAGRAAVTPPRVLLATPDFPPMPGGIQQLLAQLVRHAGWDTTVVCFADDGATARRRATCPATSCGSRDARPPRVGPAARGRHGASRSGGAVPTSCSPDTSCSARRCWPRRPSASPTRPVRLRQGARRAPADCARGRSRAWTPTIAISDYSRDLAIAAGAPAERIHLVLPGGGVDTSPTSPGAQDETSPTIVTVARLEDRYKGFDVVMRAMPLVRAQVPGRPLGRRRRRQPAVRASGRRRRAGASADYVSFLGAVDDDDARRPPAPRVGVRHAQPRPRRPRGGEGFGIVYLEAGAAGLPVVAASEGGATSAVIDGVTGLLCDPRDHVAVADRIVRLLTNPELARRLGEAGRRATARAGLGAHGARGRRHRAPIDCALTAHGDARLRRFSRGTRRSQCASASRTAQAPSTRMRWWGGAIMSSRMRQRCSVLVGRHVVGAHVSRRAQLARLGCSSRKARRSRCARSG